MGKRYGGKRSGMGNEEKERREQKMRGIGYRAQDRREIWREKMWKGK